jgi:protein-disulfide isomerase
VTDVTRPAASYVAIAAATTGFAASIASLVDSLGKAPTFCAASGCETVRQSAWAHPLGVPMPVFGVAFFAAMLVLAVDLPAHRLRRRSASGVRPTWLARPRLRVAGALAGGAFALLLISVQAFVIDAWCKLCLVADASALVHAGAVALGAATLRPRRALVALPVAVATVFALRVWAAPPGLPDLPPGTPDFVTRAQRPGEVTIVEFVDFECPYCRHMATELDAAIDDAGPVHLVRKMVPFPMHHGALPAALAWCCADAQGKGDAMAEALFSAPPDELTPEGCEKLAAQVGCDLDRYRETLADPATASRVDADIADAKAADASALPTVFVGDQRFTGANHSASELLAAIDHAAH